MKYFYPPTKSLIGFLCEKIVGQFFLYKLSIVRFLLLIFFFSFGTINAQTTLGLGDLAFTGFQSDTPEKFSFVLLKDIESGTVIHFTDFGWKEDGGFRDVTEGVLTFTAGAGFQCGDEIVILRETFEAQDADGNDAGTVSIDGNFTQSKDGDQIFAYQGTMPDENDESNFIAAIQMNGDWDDDAIDPHTSAKPDIFEDGETSIAIYPQDQNAVYDCSFSVGSPDEIAEEVNDLDNWETHHSLGLVIPPDCDFMCCLPPTIVCPDDNYDLEDGCNVEAPDPAEIFNFEGDPNPDPALPTIGEGCGALTLTHHEIESELDCIHILKRIYTVTDDEGNSASCTQTFTWMVDEEGPTFVNPPADITVECDAIPDPPMVTATDNCVPPDVLFINEIHYDNAGSDENEFIEIAGMAGIDLSDYELYAYEPDGEFDDFKQLAGIIPDEGNGWGAIAFDLGFLGSQFFENGTSGLALVKAGVRVIEFISYEGTMVATNGPAEGCTSEDIGVKESATLKEESVQKIGTGCESHHFTWIEPDSDDLDTLFSSPGFINEGQSFDSDQCPTWPVDIVFEETSEPGDCPQEQTIFRKWTATDVCGNENEHTQKITVVDTTPPTFTVPPDVTIECTDDPNDLTITGDVTDAMDNCDTGGSNPPEIWINEFHYDNSGGDVGEFIEVAGTAGLDLTNYELVLYNGNGGGTYNTVALAGTIDDESMGFGAVSFAISGIQNGSPDGIALVEGGNIVIQFLSYEGAFTATNGPANGMMSTDVGVSEPGSTPIGQSLQLTGTGSVYADFTWNSPSPESPGDLNSGQTMVPPPPPMGLPVTYFDMFLPICDGLLNNIKRTWRVTDACGNVTEQIQMITVQDLDPPTFTLPPDVTIECDQDPNDLSITGDLTNVMDNCDPDPEVSYSDDEDLTDCGGYTGTITRTWTVTDACGNSDNGTQIITIVDTTPPTFTVPDDVTIGCDDDPDDLTITGDVDDAMDNCTGVGQMSVWINEFHYDNAGGDTGEFIEIAGTAGINLSNYELVLYNGNGGGVYNTMSLSGIIPDESNGFGAIAFNYPSNGIQNGSPDGMALVQNGSNVIEFLSYEGTFTATNGPADGMTSTDVGVSESGGTPVGSSLQLVGTGSESADFSWAGPSNDSPGNLNVGQTMISVPPPTTMLTIEYEDDGDINTCDGGVIMRTWTVTDACDNSTSLVQKITVSPPDPPMITCPADMTVECFADIDVDFDDAMVETDCDLGYTGYVSYKVEGAPNCPGTTYTYTYHVIDDCGGTNGCQQVFTIENDPPTIEVIPGGTVECFDDIEVDLSDATVTTACGDDYELKILPPVVDGIMDCPGTMYIFTYRVRDQCGREVTADRIFTVGDNDPPTIVAPPDMTVECSWNININPDYADVTTSCSLGYETTVTGPVITGEEDCPGTTYTYTYTVTDDCGRTASDERVFTIENGPPIIACPENCLVQNCEDGNYLEIIDAWIATVTAESSCGEDIAVTNDYNPNNLGFCLWNGTTSVTFTATDDCGRTTVCVAMIVIVDTESPEVIVPAQDTLVLCNANTQDALDNWVANYGGAVVVDACQGDDITWEVDPPNPTINCMGMMGNVSVDVTFTASDPCGNSVSTTATFTALMGGNDVIIHGGLTTEEGEGVEAAQVMLEGNVQGMPNYQLSDIEGEFEFNNLTLEGNYVVTPEKNDDPLNGLTTYDIVLMSKHILVTELLDSPYKIIAADINKSGTVSALDIVKLRRLILFIDTEFDNNTSWRFVDAEFVFPDPMNPFATSFPEVYSINGLLDSEEADFVAIKVGDLNGSAETNSLTSGDNRNSIGELTFELEDQLLKEGEQIEIPFRSSDFNEMLGYQFTLNFDAEHMDFLEVEAGVLSEIDENNFGITMLDRGIITTSWANNLPTNVEKDKTLFTLRFVAKSSVQLSEIFRISSQYTKSEAYNNNGLLDIELNYNVDGKVRNTEFALYQNQPNPFKNETVIGFNLPESGMAKMKFFDVTGKLIKTVEGEFSKGYNEISITRADLPSTGVMYYQLETESNAATKKMILMNR